MLLCCRLYAYKRGESNKLLSFHHLPVEQKLKSYRTMKVKQNDNSLANVSISHFLANILFDYIHCVSIPGLNKSKFKFRTN